MTSRKKPPDAEQIAAAPRRRRRLLLALALVLLLLGAGAAGFFAVTTTAPDVTGLTKNQASATLTDAGFEIELLPSASDERVPAQHIIEQDPSAGSRLRRGGVVRLLNSTGPSVRVVPTLVGLRQDEAARLLVKEGLSLGAGTTAFSDRPEGQVLEADPAAGTELSPGSKVSLTVSKGLDLRPVPDVVGQKQKAAEKALQTAGLTAAASTAFSDDVAAGTVVSQDPASGSAPRGSEVALTVSKGPDTVAVPDVGGKSKQAAIDAIKQAGLVAKTSVVLNFGPGRALRTDPGKGKKVKRGSTVTIYLF